MCTKQKIYIPLVKKWKISSPFDESAKIYYYKTIKEKLRCFFQMLDNIVPSTDLIFQQAIIKNTNAMRNLLNLKLNKEEAAILEQNSKFFKMK